MADAEVIVGAAKRATVTFMVGNTVSDPTVVTAMLRDPLGAETSQVYGQTSSSIVRDGTGVYHLDQTYGIEGPSVVRFKGEGAVVVAAVEGVVNATSSFDNP